MNNELKKALEILEQEKDISRDKVLEAIKDSILSSDPKKAKVFRSTENIRIEIDRDECEFHAFAKKYVLDEGEEVRDDEVEITLEEARAINPDLKPDDEIEIELDFKEISRIATQNAKSRITQILREEERSNILHQFKECEHKVITGTIQRRIGRGWNINLGKTDAILPEKETVKDERYKPGNRIKVFVLEVQDTPKGAKIIVSRTHPDLVRGLFEEEVTEIKDGTVEIMAIARETNPSSEARGEDGKHEASRRTKMAVMSHNPNVDPVGACVGVNGSRVNVVVSELYGEKIDIINWSDNSADLIQNALSPAKIVDVFAVDATRVAKVVVPDSQLSLAIGKGGQNARLAAKLTNFKIDIKSETQAQDAFGFHKEDYELDENGYAKYDENGNPLYDENGNPLYDMNGNPLYDENGNPLYDAEGNPLYDENGNPLYDENGNPLYDADGNPLYDAEGNPLYDAEGNPLYDAEGNPLYDENGNPLYDENGNPIGANASGEEA